MHLPLIFKEAFNSSQLREILKAIPVSRAPGLSPHGAYIKGRMGSMIHVPRGEKNPIYTLIHEYGHHLDEARKAQSLPELADNKILGELMANRMGARFLMHTGSRMGEVKDFIRSMQKPIDTYRGQGLMNYIGKAYDKVRGNFSALDEKVQNGMARIMLSESMTPSPENVRFLKDTATGLAKSTGLKINDISPFTDTASPITLGTASKNIARLKGLEHNAFNKYLAKYRPKRIIGTPQVIHL